MAGGGRSRTAQSGRPRPLWGLLSFNYKVVKQVLQTARDKAMLFREHSRLLRDINTAKYLLKSKDIVVTHEVEQVVTGVMDETSEHTSVVPVPYRW